MNTLAPVKDVPVTGVRTSSNTLEVDFGDGRSVSLPLAWYPRLAQATAKERNSWQLTGGGSGIHWPLLDEDLSAAGLLAGRRSQETPASLQRWRKLRGTTSMVRRPAHPA